jgi:type I restriction enzyme S subunit
MESKVNMQIASNFFLNYISFQNFDLWDTKRYTSKVLKSKYKMVRLGDYIIEQNKKFKLNENEELEYGILGVNNQTGIFDAYVSKGKEINQPYKKMEVGWLAYNPYRINVGSIGVKRKTQRHEYISPAYVVFSCKSDIIPEYVLLLFKSESFNKIINESTTGSVRQNLSFEILKSLQFPLPSLEEQENIVNTYNEKIERAKELEREADELEKRIEQRLFNILGIKKNLIQNRNSKINITSFNFLSAWGVERLLRGGNKSILHSHLFENSKLSDKVLINPRTDLSHLGTDEKMSFIPMECISDEYGEVIELREGKKSLSGGYTKFKEGDLIWARITPCMQNGKSAIVNGLHNGVGYGSTEFHVIRSKDDNVLLDYIYHILRLKTILNDATNYFTGTAGQQRVPKSYLEELIIPVPPIEVQRMISDELYSVKSHIKDLNHQAFDLRDKAQKEFENEIFNN